MWNLEVQCHIHKGCPIFPILSRISSTPRIDTIYLKYILILCSHLRPGLPRGLFLVYFPITFWKHSYRSLILATCPALRNFLDLIALIKLGGGYSQWSPAKVLRRITYILLYWEESKLINKINKTDHSVNRIILCAVIC